MENQNFEDIYSVRNYRKLIYPFTETLLNRVKTISDFYSNFFQKIIHSTNNNFEIIVWVERLNTFKFKLIENLNEFEIKKLFIQFMFVFEFKKAFTLDFVNFEEFSFQNGKLKFSICLEHKSEIELSYIVEMFNKNKFLNNLNIENCYKIFEKCLKKQKLDENNFYFYKYSDFASNILNLFRFDSYQVWLNTKILINTENKIQSQIVGAKILQHSFNNEAFILNNIGKSESIKKVICKLLLKTSKEINDFEAIHKSIESVLNRSVYKSLIIMTNCIESSEDVETIKYLLDYSNLTNIVLIVFENTDKLDFDLVLNERPQNLLKKYFEKSYEKEKKILSKIERNILKKLEIIFVPIPLEVIPQIFTKYEINYLNQLKKCNYFQSNSDFISLRNKSIFKSMNLTANEELKILSNCIKHVDSTYLKMKYAIAIKDLKKIKFVLSSRFIIDYSEEYNCIDGIKSILLDNINFLSTDLQLLRLITIFLIKERELDDVKYLIQKFKRKDPLFFLLKLAFVYKLEKDYKKMECTLNKIKIEAKNHWRDEYFYLKFILFEKASDFKSANICLKKIKNEYFICLANFQLSDRLIYKGEYRKARTMLVDTINYFKREDFYSDELEAHSHMAKLLREQGEFNFAKKVYKNIYIKSEIRKYELLSAFIAVDIGNFYLKLDDFSNSEFWYKKALIIFQKNENVSGEILVQSNLVDINKIKGQWEEAELYLRSALKYDKDKNLITSLAVDLYNFAHLEYLKRNYFSSLELLDRSLKIFLSNNILYGITECMFLKCFIDFILDSNTFDLSFSRKYLKHLNQDQKIILSIFEKITNKCYLKNIHLIIDDIKKIESKIIRFNIMAIIVEKFSMKKYLTDLQLLSKELDRKNMNFYYYEFYWVYFNIHYEFKELRRHEYNIFIEMYYFFLRNKRILNEKIIMIKKRIDKQNSISDFLSNSKLFGKYLNWKLPEDFFKSFQQEFKRKIAINYIRLQIFKNKKLIFNFSDSSHFKELSQEIITKALQCADSMNLSLKDIQNNMHSQERLFFPYRNTKVIFWKISDDIFSVLLLGFINEQYYHIDIFENCNDLFVKFGSLFSRFYEYDYAVSKKLNFIIGESVQIKKLKKKIIKVSKVDFSLLITGESGSGKELVARAVHLLSKRSKNAFVPVNSAAIPENLLEAELFGYKRGAFTGANDDRVGLIESANEGTLFLDEIADIPISLQSKLLRVLQESEIRRLGGNSIQKVDIRLISATNKNIIDLINKNQFREDLYFRIQDIMIDVPSLRERIEDIPLLINFFFRKYGFEINDKFELQRIIEYLKSFRWKGNIRELESYIKRMITFYPDLIENSFLNQTSNRNLKRAKSDFEKSFIISALKTNNWNKVQTANQLEISRVYLFDLIKKYEIKNENEDNEPF